MNPVIDNRKARYAYEIQDKFHAGLQLTGTEVKAIREGKVSLAESYVVVSSSGELWVKGMHISEFSHGSYANHPPLRERKLLLKKREIEKIAKKLNDKGLTLIPLKMYFSDKGWCKMDIAIAKGKHLHDKRQSIRNREDARDLREAKRI
ncbi:MAG: SsrA-binding protein SmpB [Flavobacteriales bacterium]|jgi:SsrA-binding protein|nr:SsrA-binding protein SmpB [Flavobacteriales bacterium]MDE0791620.1 SsrA-binding protein SmpB [Schleiferiaceae bacterium]MBT3572318.1 SsrA-binding protein SmpB [Flavobacteriales bacterium]MBT3677755.1 SsrA-binding protein SmpB [Flavobacteriales bacterium]MBT3740154.1 SsrA-binding protein SmpB [Flavobacteriales bacterium]|tara:strand:+ start:378 stop:824 length:447 start_codon:yes stop_codon:yes gene_type:complete